MEKKKRSEFLYHIKQELTSPPARNSVAYEKFNDLGLFYERSIGDLLEQIVSMAIKTPVINARDGRSKVLEVTLSDAKYEAILATHVASMFMENGIVPKELVFERLPKEDEREYPCRCWFAFN